jgi:predicted tellurium resistance membrane protein TerC
VALVARIILLSVILALANLSKPILLHFSVRDLTLLTGGLFLLYKAAKEIHQTVELKEEEREAHGPFFSHHHRCFHLHGRIAPTCSQSLHLSAHGIRFARGHASNEI